MGTAKFTIWQPRWHDKTVLLAKHKVNDTNEVCFTKAPSLGTEPYYVSGEIVKKCKIESNGKIDCYAVPLTELKKMGEGGI